MVAANLGPNYDLAIRLANIERRLAALSSQQVLQNSSATQSDGSVGLAITGNGPSGTTQTTWHYGPGTAGASETAGQWPPFAQVGQTVAGGVPTGTAMTFFDVSGNPVVAVSQAGLQMSGGSITGGTAITGGAISGGTITGGAISGGTITGGAISGGTITGTSITTQNLYVTDGSGHTLSLEQALLGVGASSAAGALTFGVGGSNAANTNITDPSLSVTVNVTTGKLLVTMSGKLTVSNGIGDLEMGAAISGPSTQAFSRNNALANFWNGFGSNGIVQGSWTYLYTGLTNGSYTITPTYYLGSVGSPAAGGIAAYRTVLAQPY